MDVDLGQSPTWIRRVLPTAAELTFPKPFGCHRSKVRRRLENVERAGDEGIALLGVPVQGLGRNGLYRRQRILDAVFHLFHEQLLLLLSPLALGDIPSNFLEAPTILSSVFLSGDP